MKRDEFMARVHELAEQLGAKLYTLVVKQGELARAGALELARVKLATELYPAPRPAKAPREPKPSKHVRKQQRCRTCVEAGRPGLGHNAKTCGREEIGEPDAEPDAASPPPTVPIASPASRRRSPRAAPPGWTLDGDRREEFQALSELTISRKTG